MNGTGLTFGELFESYMANHCRVHCTTWRNIERMYESYLKHLDDRPANQLSRFDFQQIHSQIGTSGRQTTANRVIQLVRAIYNRGKDWDLVTTNPATRIRMFRLQARERFMQRGEVVRFWEELDKLRYGVTRDFLLMCLLTAARRSNVAAMQWDEINWEENVWRVPITKNGTSQYIPLPALAMTLLHKRHRFAQSRWVFPSHRSQVGHITRPENAWKVLTERAGLTDLRIHDLRRTLASYQAINNTNISTIAQTLNHKDLKSTMIYARLQIDPVRSSMEAAISDMMRHCPPKELRKNSY